MSYDSEMHLDPNIIYLSSKVMFGHNSGFKLIVYKNNFILESNLLTRYKPNYRLYGLRIAYRTLQSANGEQVGTTNYKPLTVGSWRNVGS